MGAKGLNLLSIFEEMRVIAKYLGIFVDDMFLIGKSAQENLGSSKKVIFLFQNHVFILWSTTLPRICRLNGTWGAFPLFSP